MTRLANVEKAGYFPLPQLASDAICAHIAAPHGGHILDPCAGEGTALVTLADKLGLDPFGVELHEGRAKSAREAVSQLLVSRHGSDKGDTPPWLGKSHFASPASQPEGDEPVAFLPAG